MAWVLVPDELVKVDQTNTGILGSSWAQTQ